MESMLTTVDNPYDPFTKFDEWRQWDEAAGYYSTSLLARITIMSEDMSEADQSVAIEKAIDEIVNENAIGVYKKVQKDSESSASTP